jgi:hypothetical protein
MHGSIITPFCFCGGANVSPHPLLAGNSEKAKEMPDWNALILLILIA